jgi:DNA-binding GntR family transcriptional regulator
MSSRLKSGPTRPARRAGPATRQPKTQQLAPESNNTLDLRARLREDIVSCALTPGQRLKFEELRARYDVGIGSLRESLLQLEADGLVIAESNRGFCVAPVSIADLEDITELRVDIERKSLTQSIQNGDDAWESSIVAAFHMLVKMETDITQTPLRNREVWEERHRRFHDALVSACPSPWLMRFRRILWDQTQRYRSLSLMQSRTPGRVDKHRDLMELAVTRKLPEAAVAMEQHIRHTADNVREWLAVHRPGVAKVDYFKNKNSDLLGNPRRT